MFVSEAEEFEINLLSADYHLSNETLLTRVLPTGNTPKPTT